MGCCSRQKSRRHIPELATGPELRQTETVMNLQGVTQFKKSLKVLLKGLSSQFEFGLKWYG
jgi:hypothetical protein